ncbi:MAG TPA: heterodisulfide reductase-related iron-sulfur binding cluster [Dongiaceae bacterium]|jgi:glycerol-3-phosphate dehydrogenase subunit C|nr:heterodisulfide reductase-related iron-sulfur binding cluster [Dongiaceae bacterium]
MSEGSLDAPTRHPLAWNDPDFTDPAKLDEEMRRVFDICHGCRRCFNLCDSFPRLFDLVDASPSGEVEGVKSEDFAQVVEACTLCDLCFMTKCPYVPPHPFNLDFPHLILRYRYAELKGGKKEGLPGELARTDRNGKLAGAVAPLANWATSRKNRLARAAMEKIVDVHRDAALPKFHGKTFALQAKSSPPPLNREAPGFGRKVVLYATCFVNYNNPAIGMATRAVLAKNGVESEVVYPRCCGMPQLEQGDLPKVAESARQVSKDLLPWIDKGYDVIALVPSCALMLKFEWPLILPDDEGVKRLSAATSDISEYIVKLAKGPGLAPGLKPLEGGVALHLACHARAQNMGQKAKELLALIPDADLQVIERCSGHGGSWGVRKENFDVALKIGRPVARQAKDSGKRFVASECPLAGEHILQGIERQGGTPPASAPHPIELFAQAYGI